MRQDTPRRPGLPAVHQPDPVDGRLPPAFPYQSYAFFVYALTLLPYDLHITRASAGHSGPPGSDTARRPVAGRRKHGRRRGPHRPAAALRTGAEDELADERGATRFEVRPDALPNLKEDRARPITALCSSGSTFSWAVLRSALRTEPEHASGVAPCRTGNRSVTVGRGGGGIRERPEVPLAVAEARRAFGLPGEGKAGVENNPLRTPSLRLQQLTAPESVPDRALTGHGERRRAREPERSGMSTATQCSRRVGDPVDTPGS